VKKKEQAYELIKKAIFECKFLPGQVLNEIELAEWLGISRTPLREALAALEKDGFVNIIPNRGPFVCDITPTEVEEILDVREVLEVFAIKLATPYIPEEEIDEVCKMTEEYLQRKEIDPTKMLEIDMAVHQLFLDYCGNETLKNLLRYISDNIKRMRIRSLHISERLEQSTIEHQQILKAVKARDVALAEQLMRQHIQNTKANSMMALRIPIMKRN
jgi:DNA-binding GntR family transcriptional regulator